MRSTIILASIIALVSSTSATAAGTSPKELAQQETGGLETTKARSKPGISLKMKLMIAGGAIVAGGGVAVLLMRNSDKLSALFPGSSKGGAKPETYVDALKSNTTESLSGLSARLKTADKGAIQGEIAKNKNYFTTSPLPLIKDKTYLSDAKILQGRFEGVIEAAETEENVGEILEDALLQTRMQYMGHYRENEIREARFTGLYSRFLVKKVNRDQFLKGKRIFFKDWQGDAEVNYPNTNQPVTILDPHLEALYNKLLPEFQIFDILAVNNKPLEAADEYKGELSELVRLALFGQDDSQITHQAGVLKKTIVQLSKEAKTVHEKNIVPQLIKLLPDHFKVEEDAPKKNTQDPSKEEKND